MSDTDNTALPEPARGSGPVLSRAQPNRPKPRTDAEPLITAQQRRRLLGSSFADQQTLVEAWEYHDVRPRYPQQAVADILGLHRCPEQSSPEESSLKEPAARIVELGAGTGILTRQLLAHGAQVHAVEPSTVMTEVLAQTAGPYAEQLQISNTSAEDTGLDGGQADLVLAAQAWHWFDTEAVQTEAARLLKPAGALALIWNYLDTAEPTAHRLARIMRAGDTYRPGWQPVLDQMRFSRAQSTEYRWSRTLTVGQIFRYATTLSSWLTAEQADRARRRANLSDYLYRELGLNDEEAVELPQITVLHTAPSHFVASLRR